MLREELKAEFDQLMNSKQAAEYLGITVKALQRRCETTNIPRHIKDGRNYFSKRELNDYYLT